MKKRIFNIFLGFVLIFMIFTTFTACKPQKKEINFYLTMGTLPTMYAGLDLINTRNESYIWYERASTFNTNYLPTNAEVISKIGDYNKGVITSVKNKIKWLKENEKNVHFNFFTDDLRVQFFIQIAKGLNLKDDEYNVTLFSDGTATYHYFNSMYNGENAVKNWYDNGARLNYLLENYNVDNSIIDINQNMNEFRLMYNASELKNVKYVLGFLDELNTDSEIIREKIKSANFEEKKVFDLYDKLSKKKKEQFKLLLDYEEINQILDKKDKPYLVITGTSLQGENGRFEEAVKKINNEYKDEYNIVFKPHPAFSPHTNEELKKLNREEFLNDLDIKILPAHFPIEILTFENKKVKIGGYPSSLYMNVRTSQIEFLITENVNEMVYPLNSLYQKGYFENVNIYA